MKFVQTLNDVASIGLKKSKLLMDTMLEGTPIIVEIDDELLNKFITRLDEFNMEYEVYKPN